MKKTKVIFFGLLALLATSCKNRHDDPKPDPETTSFSVQSLDPYHFIVRLNNTNVIDHTFIYPNGETSREIVDTVYFPFKGSYDIKLEVTTANGTESSSKNVKVSSDDPSNPDLKDPIVTLLTGGLQDTDGKTWVVCTAPYLTGMGPLSTLTPDWWNYPAGLNGTAWDNGMVQNSFTFNLRNYQYIPKNTWVTAHWDYANRYFGTQQNMYEDIALSDPDHVQAPFIVKNSQTGVGTGYTIDIANNSYIGYFEKRNHYEIVSISSDTLRIRNHYNDNSYADPTDDQGARYFVLIAQH